MYHMCVLVGVWVFLAVKPNNCTTKFQNPKQSDEKKDLKYLMQWTSPSKSPFVDMGEGQKNRRTKLQNPKQSDMKKDLKYIQQWTSPSKSPFVDMGEGQKNRRTKLQNPKQSDMKKDLKYIQQWTSPSKSPFVDMGEGQKNRRTKLQNPKQSDMKKDLKYIQQWTSPSKSPFVDMGEGQKNRRTKLQNPKQSDKKKDLKYILQWTPSSSLLFRKMAEGQKQFIAGNCPHTNCFVTHDRNLLGDVTAFDVIVFAGTDLVSAKLEDLPQKRSPHQKYAFGSVESPDNYPMCNPIFDGFFNWTWTYKLDSDSRWGYLIVRDREDKVIGPNVNMHWIKNMKPIDDAMKLKLKSKTKAAAWFVSNCVPRSGRVNFVKEVQRHLRLFNLAVDVYGSCGTLSCSKSKKEDCLKMLQRDYYFYFSFENTFSEDYVSEKLLNGLLSDTVPVVYGGANYTRFMPDGIYLNARDLGEKRLAQTMYDIMQDPEWYYSFFNYKNHYKYSNRNDHNDTNDFCGFCALLNDQKRVKARTVYGNFREWWNTKPTNRC